MRDVPTLQAFKLRFRSRFRLNLCEHSESRDPGICFGCVGKFSTIICGNSQICPTKESILGSGADGSHQFRTATALRSPRALPLAKFERCTSRELRGEDEFRWEDGDMLPETPYLNERPGHTKPQLRIGM